MFQSELIEEVRLSLEEFQEQFDAIVDSIQADTKRIWIINHRVAFIPHKLYQELIDSFGELDLYCQK